MNSANVAMAIIFTFCSADMVQERDSSQDNHFFSFSFFELKKRKTNNEKKNKLHRLFLLELYGFSTHDSFSETFFALGFRRLITYSTFSHSPPNMALLMFSRTSGGPGCVSGFKFIR